MADLKITDLTAAETYTDDNLIILDQNDGTKKITTGNLFSPLKKSENISYDGSSSGISGATVAAAVTELKTDIDNCYTKASIDASLATKANKTELSTETTRAQQAEQTNAKAISTETTRAQQIEGTKANSADVYLKTETYTKTETNSAISTAVTDKQLKIKALTIPAASVVANTDELKDDEGYCYDYAWAECTADTWADVVGATKADEITWGLYSEGVNFTDTGTIRIYMFAKPTADINVIIKYQKGVTA